MTEKIEQFKQVLDDHHQWPCPYTFKFIVPTENLSELESCFPENTIEKRESKTGKYTSVTMETTMTSSNEVLETYNKASQVPGVMTL